MEKYISEDEIIYIHFIDSFSLKKYAYKLLDEKIDVEVITTSRIQARSIWKAMCKVCEEKCLKKLDTFVEDIEKSCDLIFKALQKEYDLQHVIAVSSNIIKV